MLLSVNSLSEFDAGEHPFIYGSATDLGGNPLAGVDIQANFPLRTITATTDSAGEFSMTYPVTSELGEYTVTVYATKNNMHLNTQVTYHVIDRQQESSNAEQENISKPKEYDNSMYDLFSRTILEQIEEQKAADTKREVISAEQQLISKQRLQIQADLDDDLKSFEKQYEFYKPRNAFLRFLADIDHSVKNIFWNQFLFTEKKTEDAHIAKENALDEGKTSIEAMKIFQTKAATAQSEIMDYNKELSIKYGNATSDIQSQFDENGKISTDE